MNILNSNHICFLALVLLVCSTFSPVLGGSSKPTCKRVYCNEELFALQRCNRALICNTTNIEPGQIDVIPSPKGLFMPDRVPSDPKLTLAYTITGLYGEHIPGQFAAFRVFLSGAVPGLAVTAKIFYDFSGDGSFDRTETFDVFSVSGFAGAFVEWTQYAPGNLRFIGGENYKNFNNGRVKIVFWQPYGFNQVYIRTDRAISGQLSLVRLPYESISSSKCNCPLSPVSGLLTTFGSSADAITSTTTTTTSTSTTTSSTTNTGGTTTTSTSSTGNSTIFD